MLREPYNLNPYNSTIDTSLIQPFSFVFSGDKLGSYQIQIAENNTEGTVLYTSPLIEADEIYDGDVVTAYLPSIVQTNINNGDGRFSYVYKLTTPGTYIPLSGDTAPEFEPDTYYIYVEEEDVYTPLDEEPSGWTTNFRSYFSYIPASSPMPENTSSIEFYYYHPSAIDEPSIDDIIKDARERYIFNTTTIDIVNSRILTSTGRSTSLPVVFVCKNAQNIELSRGAGELNFEYYQIKVSKDKGLIIDSDNIASYAMQIDSYVFDSLSFSSIAGEDDMYYTINLKVMSTGVNPAPTNPLYYTLPSIVQYYLYYPEGQTSLKDYVGKDLIWRVLMWEDKKGDTAPQVHNFVRNGQIIAYTYNGSGSNPVPLNARTEIGVLMPIIETYEADTTHSVTRHCYINETAECIAWQEDTNWYLYVPITHAFDDYTVDSSDFKFAIIDNIYFTVGTIVTAEHPYDAVSGLDEYYKISITPMCTVSATYGVRSLVSGQYYGYELIMDDGETRTFFDETVTYTKYSPKTFGHSEKYQIVSYAKGVRGAISLEPPQYPYEGAYNYIYAQYSTGNVRGYVEALLTDIALENNEPLFPIGGVYQLYSNFVFSNWNFFQSRQNPVVTLQYFNNGNQTWSNLPTVDYSEREIKLKATYTQWDLIPIRYHQWILYNKLGEIVTDSGRIYDSDLSYSLSPLAEVENYTILLNIVSQNNVVTTVSTMLSTYFPLLFATTNTPEVNEESHYATILWDAALSASPSENSELSNPQIYRNNINITSDYSDFQLSEGVLIYDRISGNAFGNSIVLNNFSFRMGFTVDDNLEEYDMSDLLQMAFTQKDITLDKEGYLLKLKDGNSERWTINLLNPTLGVGQYPTTESHRGEWLQWIDGDWDDSKYWVETSSNTSEFYYQLLIKGSETSGKSKASIIRIPYMRGKLTEDNISTVEIEGVDYTQITVPYNNLLIAAGASNCHMRFDSNVNTIREITEITDDGNGETMTITLTTLGVSSGQYVIYSSLPSNQNSYNYLASGSIGVDDSNYLNKFEFNPRINLYYTQLQSVYVDGDKPTNITDKNWFGPIEDLEKPHWDQGILGKFILLDYNYNLQSHQGGAAGNDSLAIYAYEVYRVKYATREDAEHSVEKDGGYSVLGRKEIYTRYLGTVNLVNEELISAAQIKFYDWSIENNGWFRYKIIPLGTTYEKILYSEAFKTDWYGWSFSSFEPSNGHYDIIERWNYYLNLETKGYSHVTNKVFHQGFNRYPKVSVGTTDYITSDMTGLIGEFKQTYDWDNMIGGNYYSDDTIERIYRWENFINDGHMILVKDYKGRAYIAQLDGGATNFQDVEREILSTTSFNITQIDDVSNYAIFKAVDAVRETIEEEE